MLRVGLKIPYLVSMPDGDSSLRSIRRLEPLGVPLRRPCSSAPLREPITAGVHRRHRAPTCRHHCSDPPPRWRVSSAQPPPRATPLPLIRRDPRRPVSRFKKPDGRKLRIPRVRAPRVGTSGTFVRPRALGSLAPNGASVNVRPSWAGPCAAVSGARNRQRRLAHRGPASF